MTAELPEILIDIAQRWLEQDCDPPLCRLKGLTRSFSGADLAELKAIREQEEATYQDACFEASKRWQHSLKLRGHQGQLVSVPLLAQIKAKYSLERLKKQIDSDALAVYSNWCDQRGWTDLFVNEGHFWAFPPSAVLPLSISGAGTPQLPKLTD